MTELADRPRVVLDCNVLVQAISNAAGPSGRCLQLLERGAIALYISRQVSRDRDLLDLATDHSLVGKQFRQRFPRLSVLNPVAFLDSISPAPDHSGGNAPA